MSDALNKKLRSVEDAKHEVENKRDTFKNEAAALERELEAMKRQVSNRALLFTCSFV